MARTGHVGFVFSLLAFVFLETGFGVGVGDGNGLFIFKYTALLVSLLYVWYSVIAFIVLVAK